MVRAALVAAQGEEPKDPGGYANTPCEYRSGQGNRVLIFCDFILTERRKNPKSIRLDFADTGPPLLSRILDSSLREE